MTVEKLFELCAGIFGEHGSDCAVWRNGFLGMLNSVLAECWDLENGIRLANGQSEVKEPIMVNAFSDNIDCDESLLLSCVVWGVCALLASSDDDNVRAGYFNNKFEVGKMYALKGRWEDIEKHY